MLEKLSLCNISELGHETERQSPFLHLPYFGFPPRFPDIDPLPHNGPWSRLYGFVLSALGDKVKGMIPLLAVFLAGVTGHTVPKHERILSAEYIEHLLRGPVFFHLQVLAIDKAISG